MKKLLLFASFVMLGMLSHQAGAQTIQWWDNNGTSAPTSGTWDTTTPNWAESSTLTVSTAPFIDGNFPIFAGGSSTISSLTINVPGEVSCEGLGDGTNSAESVSGAPVTALNFSGTGSINLPDGGWDFDCGVSGNLITISVPITGPGGFTQHNSGFLALYGTNTYSGGTTMTGSQVIYYNNSNSFGTGPVTNSGSSSLLTTNSSNNLVTLPNAFYLNTTGVLNFGSGNTICTGPFYLGATTQLKNNGTGTALTISGPISSPGGAYGIDLQCDNTGGNITLNGPSTYTGPTGIGTGAAGATTIVHLTSINSVSTPPQQPSSSLGVPSSAANGTIAIGSASYAGEMIYSGAGETSDRVINLAGTTGGAIIEMDGAGPLVLTSPFTATGAGAKALTLQGSSTATNTIGGAIVNSTSATSLTKAQAGTWVLAGRNTFTGNTTISGGTLIIGGAGGLGNGAYSGTISDTATFIYDSTAAQTLSGVVSGAGAVQQIGAGNLTLTATNTFTGGLTIGAGSTFLVGGAGKLSATTPVAINGTFDMTSTGGQTIGGIVSGSGTFIQASTTTTTFTNLNNTFSGSFSVTSGLISVNSDACYGTPPAAFTNQITLNGGTQYGLRANSSGIVINPNRGIALGANGGEIQVASGDTCTYNGVISGSGNFQDGQTSSTGLGTLVLGGVETYTGMTVVSTGTLRLASTGSLASSSGILMSNASTFDVSGQSPFALSGNNSFFTAIGGATTTATILGPSGGNVNFGSMPVNLSFVPSSTSGSTDAALTISQGTLVLNGNTVNVTNASALTLGVGSYTLIQQTTGSLSVASPLTLNYFGPAIAANATASLMASGGTLSLVISTNTAGAPGSFSGAALQPDGTVLLSFSGTPGANYVIQSTTNLTPPAVWMPISTNTAGTDGTFQFDDVNSTNVPVQFYRAQP